MSGIRKISSFKRKTSLERVPVLPIHEKYAERVQDDLDPFGDIIGRFAYINVNVILVKIVTKYRRKECKMT